MSTATRFTIALIVSLGFGGNAIATPVTFDLASATSENNILSSFATHQLNIIQTKTDTSLTEASLNAQHNHTDTEQLKKKPGKISKVAEPSSLLLLGLGLVGLGFLRRRKH